MFRQCVSSCISSSSLWLTVVTLKCHALKHLLLHPISHSSSVFGSQFTALVYLYYHKSVSAFVCVLRMYHLPLFYFTKQPNKADFTLAITGQRKIKKKGERTREKGWQSTDDPCHKGCGDFLVKENAPISVPAQTVWLEKAESMYLLTYSRNSKSAKY